MSASAPIRLHLTLGLGRAAGATTALEATVALRSAFGWALRRQVCVTQAPRCDGCPLRARCAYGRLFDPAPPVAPIHPSLTSGIPGYALAPAPEQPEDPQSRAIEFTLLAPERGDPALVAAMLAAAIDGNRGYLGGNARLDCIRDEPLAAIRLPERPSASADTDAGSAVGFTLHAESPLAIKQDNRELTRGDDLRSETLWRLAWRRLTQYAQLVGSTLPDPAPWRAAALACTADGTRLIRVSTQRRSQTQGGRVYAIEGLVGPIEVRGPRRAIVPLHDLLARAAPLQLGKDTVFGLGRVGLGRPEDSRCPPPVASS